MILILTSARDPHADHVALKLDARGAAFVRFDPAEVPRTAQIAFGCTPSGQAQQILLRGRQRIDLAEVHAIWYRRPESPVPHDDIVDAKMRELVELECGMVLQDLWNSLDAAWLPGLPLTIRRAEYKGLQLKIAGQLGFELPPTLTTSSPDAMLEFYRRHDGRIVSKQAATGFHATIGLGTVRYTELVTTRDLVHCHDLARCPMTFQAYVPKRVELRITVVGQRVFTAEIHSQASNHTRYDWRRYDLTRTPHLPHALPPDVARRCVVLAERLGLQYGAIDMILTPDGRYVFLEINPNGQYLWIERQTGLPISDAICDLLLGEPR